MKILEILSSILVISIIAAFILLIPFALIWAFNVFGFDFDYTFKNWVATVVIFLTLSLIFGR